MAKYAASEPMYQCYALECKIWFSDREGIKVLVGGTNPPTTLTPTHIVCPKCYDERPGGTLPQLRIKPPSAQLRHEKCIHG